MKIAKRLLALEAKALGDGSLGTAPGTMLKRARGCDGRMLWCLRLGPLSQPKRFFYAETISGAIRKAEKAFFGKEQGR